MFRAHKVRIKEQVSFFVMSVPSGSLGLKDSLSPVTLNRVASLLLRFHSVFSFIILRNTITCHFWCLPLGRSWHLFLVIDHFHNQLFTFTEYSRVCSVWTCEDPQWFPGSPSQPLGSQRSINREVSTSLPRRGHCREKVGGLPAQVWPSKTRWKWKRGENGRSSLWTQDT